MTSWTLNSYQKNYIYASLRSFENALRQVNRILDRGNERGILFYQQIHQDPETRRAAKEKVQQMLQELSVYIKELGLEPVEENPFQKIMALMSLSWENLAEIQPKRLRSYGDIDDETADQIASKASRLAQMAMELSNICTNEKHSASS
jgi:hypothetical protein